MNQWQVCPRILLLQNFVQAMNFLLVITNCAVTSNICFKVRLSWFLTTLWIVEKFFPTNVAAFNVVAMNIPHIIECSVQSSASSDILFCRIRTWSTAHDEIFGISLLLVMPWHKFPRSIVNRLSVPYGMRISAEKRFLTKRVNLLQCIPRNTLRFPWSIVLRSSTFPLLRRPRLTIVLFWITWWWRVSQVSPIYRHLQQIFQDLDIHTRSSPGLMRLKKTRTKAFLRLNSSWVVIWLWHVLLLILVELVLPSQRCKVQS